MVGFSESNDYFLEVNDVIVGESNFIFSAKLSANASSLAESFAGFEDFPALIVTSTS